LGKVCAPPPPSNDSATEGDAMDVASGLLVYPTVKSSDFLGPVPEGGSQRPARTGTARTGTARTGTARTGKIQRRSEK
jgi:hypothetical protein